MYQTCFKTERDFNQNEFLQNLDRANCNQQQPVTIHFNFLNYLNSSNTQNEGKSEFWVRNFEILHVLQVISRCDKDFTACEWINMLELVYLDHRASKGVTVQSPFWGNFVPFSGHFLRSHRKSHGWQLFNATTTLVTTIIARSTIIEINLLLLYCLKAI